MLLTHTFLTEILAKGKNWSKCLENEPPGIPWSVSKSTMEVAGLGSHCQQPVQRIPHPGSQMHLLAGWSWTGHSLGVAGVGPGRMQLAVMQPASLRWGLIVLPGAVS